MKIFFDTEFNGLRQNTELLSIGLVTENYRGGLYAKDWKPAYFYAEFPIPENVDPWVEVNVISHFATEDPYFHQELNEMEDCSFVSGSREQIRDALRVWLNRFDSVELVSDVCHYDMTLFCEIFGGAFGLPNQVSPVCYDINQDIMLYWNLGQQEAFDASREDLLDKLYLRHIPGKKHNSLYDAKVIKAIYEAIHPEILGAYNRG